ncbi:MAG: hypothetical protein ACRCZI_02600 [Cetobacterium sp.]
MKESAENIQKKINIELLYNKKYTNKSTNNLYKLGITDRYIKNVITVVLDNLTKLNIDELVNIIV